MWSYGFCLANWGLARFHSGGCHGQFTWKFVYASFGSSKIEGRAHDIAMALVLPHLADVCKWIQGSLCPSGDNKWFVPCGDPECNSAQEEFIFNVWRAAGAQFQIFSQLQKENWHKQGLSNWSGIYTYACADRVRSVKHWFRTRGYSPCPKYITSGGPNFDICMDKLNQRFERGGGPIWRTGHCIPDPNAPASAVRAQKVPPLKQIGGDGSEV